MLESKKIHILGYSGHALVVVDVALSNNYFIAGYFNKIEVNENPYELKFFGDESEVDIKIIVNNNYVFPAIGSNSIRNKLVNFIENNKLKQIKLIDASASVSSKAQVEVSSLIAPKAVINSMALIGKGCIINTGAIIEHECKISNFTHIAPGAVLAGNVRVGTNTFIGANTVIKQGVSIGNNVTVGAGSVVIRDIPDGEVWIGNPAKKLK